MLDGQVHLGADLNGADPQRQRADHRQLHRGRAPSSLATSLKFGALPIAFEKDAAGRGRSDPRSPATSSPAGITAGIIGLLLVMLYCLLYYRGLGLVVIASLLVAARHRPTRMVLLLSKRGRLHADPARHRRPDRRGRHHRRLVHRLLRAHPRRDARRQVDAGRGRDRLDAGPEHLPGGRRGLAARRGRALHLRRRRREGLRVRAGPVHADRPRGVLLVHPPDGVVAGPLPVLQPGHKLSGLDARDARASTASRREGGPDGQVLAARQRPLHRSQVDRLRRPHVALVRRLGRHRRRWPSLGLCVQGPQLRHRVHRRRAVHASRCRSSEVDPGRTPTSCATAVAGTGIDARRSTRSSPPRAASAILVQTEPLDRRGERRDRRRDRPGRPASTRRTTSPRPRSAPSWGKEVAKRSLLGLAVFLVLVVLFIWAYFREWKMSVAAIVALAHDVADHHRRLRALRLRGDAGDGDRRADHPRLLALRHRRGLRQGAREHHEPAGAPHDVRRGGQPRRQPDPGALDQHLDRGADPGRRDPLRRRGPARLGLAQGPRARAVRRHGRRCLLLDLHRARRCWCS